MNPESEDTFISWSLKGGLSVENPDINDIIRIPIEDINDFKILLNIIRRDFPEYVESETDLYFTSNNSDIKNKDKSSSQVDYKSIEKCLNNKPKGVTLSQILKKYKVNINTKALGIDSITTFSDNSILSKNNIENVVIAGSYSLSTIYNIPYNDLDLYIIGDYSKKEYMEKVTKLLKVLCSEEENQSKLKFCEKRLKAKKVWKEKGYSKPAIKKFNISFVERYKDFFMVDHMYQILLYKVKNIKSLLSSFDIDICSCAFDKDYYYLTYRCYLALIYGMITFEYDMRTANIEKRLIKYFNKGIEILFPNLKLEDIYIDFSKEDKGGLCFVINNIYDKSIKTFYNIHNQENLKKASYKLLDIEEEYIIKVIDNNICHIPYLSIYDEVISDFDIKLFDINQNLVLDHIDKISSKSERLFTQKSLFKWFPTKKIKASFEKSFFDQDIWDIVKRTRDAMNDQQREDWLYLKVKPIPDINQLSFLNVWFRKAIRHYSEVWRIIEILNSTFEDHWIIAGGFIIQYLLSCEQYDFKVWVHYNKITDVDIFIYGYKDQDEYLKPFRKFISILKLQNQLPKLFRRSKNSFKFKRKNSIEFDLVLTRNSSKEEILDNFDIDICSVGYNTTNGLIFNDKGLKAFNSKTITIEPDKYHKNFAERLLKYESRKVKLNFDNCSKKVKKSLKNEMNLTKHNSFLSNKPNYEYFNLRNFSIEEILFRKFWINNSKVRQFNQINTFKYAFKSLCKNDLNLKDMKKILEYTNDIINNILTESDLSNSQPYEPFEKEGIEWVVSMRKFKF